MAFGLLVGNDSEVADWAFSTYSLYPTRVDRGLGIVNEEMCVVGAILLQNFNGTNVELSYYGPNTLSVGIVRAIARIIIGEFNASRLTVVTSKKNKRLLRSIQRFGFKFEGIQRCYYGARDCTRNTGVRFVMFREDLERVAKLTAFIPIAKQKLH